MGSRRGVRRSRPALDERRRWAALIVLCIGQVMIVLDATAVNVALPSIQRQFHFSEASLAWVVNGYLLTFGGLLLLAGRLGDLIGRTRIFMGGLAAFTVTSMLCGVAPNGGVLVGARFLQGVTAAMVASMVLGIISPMFPEPRERATALSIFAFVAMGGASLGLVMGGVITQLLGWHWIFFVNVPVGVGALAAGRRLIHPEGGIGLSEGADLPGALLVTGAPALAVYAMVNAANSSWVSAATLAPLIAAVSCAVLFALVESKVSTPLIPPRILRNRVLASAAMVRTIFPVGGYGLNFLGALYLQHVLGYSPLATGLAYLPSTLGIGVVSVTLTPRVARRFGQKVPTLVGLAFVTVSMLTMARITDHSVYVSGVLPTMILNGIGFGLVFTPTVTIVMSSVAHTDAGLASGVNSVSVQLGAALGVAALATISASRTSALLARHDSLLPALTEGYRLAFVAGAAATALSFLLALFLLESDRPRAVRGRAAATALEPPTIFVPEG